MKRKQEEWIEGFPGSLQWVPLGSPDGSCSGSCQTDSNRFRFRRYRGSAYRLGDFHSGSVHESTPKTKEDKKKCHRKYTQWKKRSSIDWIRRKIRLTKGNSKCPHLKKLTCKGTLRQVFISRRPRNRTYSPEHTVYVYTVFSVHIHTGRGGGGNWEKVRGATVNRAGSKIRTWLTVSPAYKL